MLTGDKLYYLLLKKAMIAMSMNVQLGGTKAADISGKDKQKG